MEKIFLFGAGEHTKYTIDIIEKENKYRIVGILAENIEKGNTYAGYEILGKFADTPAIIEKYKTQLGIVAIGDNNSRHKVANTILNLVPDFTFVNAIHPSAVIGKNVIIKPGTVVMAGAIINNDCIIGEQCFLATKCSIDHDSVMGEYSSLSPGVTTGGKTIIGKFTAIGIGAVILHGKKIGDHTVIGAGALVTKDIEDLVVAYGSPAKVIRTREVGERYL